MSPGQRSTWANGFRANWKGASGPGPMSDHLVKISLPPSHLHFIYLIRFTDLVFNFMTLKANFFDN